MTRTADPKTADTSKLRDKVRQHADAAAAAGGEVERAAPAHPTQDLLERVTPQLATALPRGMDVERFKRTVWSVVRTNRQLLEATPSSVIGGVLQAAQLGLELGPLGHAYLVPFKDRKRGTVEAQFILGYKGVVALARRSGAIESIVARAVHPGDSFDYEYGLIERLEHRPTGDPAQPYTHVYAVARYVGGGHNFVVLTRAQVHTYRARSRAKDSGPWVTDEEAMGLKTALRRLTPWLPLTVEEAQLLAHDERAYTLDPGTVDVIDITPDETLDGLAGGEHPDTPSEPVEGTVEAADQREEGGR